MRWADLQEELKALFNRLLAEAGGVAGEEGRAPTELGHF